MAKASNPEFARLDAEMKLDRSTDIYATLEPLRTELTAFCVLAAGYKRAHNHALMTSLFDLPKGEKATRRVHSVAELDFPAVRHNFSIRGYGDSSCTLYWTNTSGKLAMGQNSPPKIAQAKYNDIVVANGDNSRPFDLVVCVITAYSDRVNKIERMVFEVPYIHCPEIFVNQGLVVETNEETKSEVHWKQFSKSEVDTAYKEHHESRRPKLRNSLQQVFNGHSEALRAPPPKRGWLHSIFRPHSEESKKQYDVSEVPIVYSSENETLYLNGRRWLPDLWLTIFLRLKDESLFAFYVMTTAHRQLDEEQTAKALAHAKAAVERQRALGFPDHNELRYQALVQRVRTDK